MFSDALASLALIIVTHSLTDWLTHRNWIWAILHIHIWQLSHHQSCITSNWDQTRPDQTKIDKCTFLKLRNVFSPIVKCICLKLWSVFVWNYKCICPNCKIYFELVLHLICLYVGSDVIAEIYPTCKNVFAQLTKYICLMCKINFAKLPNVFISIAKMCSPKWSWLIA